MAAVWPTSLPANFITSGFEMAQQNAVIRTQMDTGAPKRRRRFTAAIKMIKGSMVLTTTQYSTLDAFYTSTLKNGSLPFDFAHPISGSSISCYFTEPPKYTANGPWLVNASISLEVLP